MTLRRLQWLTVLAPLVFAGGLVLPQRALARDGRYSWPSYFLLAVVTLSAL